MVVIYHGSQTKTYPLDELKKMTSQDIISDVTGKEFDGCSFLTKCGARLPQELANVDLHEQDFLRIVQSEKPSTSNINPNEVERQRKEYKNRHKNITTVEANRAMHLEMVNCLTDPQFFEKTLKEFPDMANDPELCAYVSDPYLLMAILKDSPANIQFCVKHPLVLQIIKKVLYPVMDPTVRLPFIPPALRPAPVGAAAPRPAAAPAAQAITPQMLQDAINFAITGGQAPNAAPANAAPRPAPNPEQEAEQILRQQYTEQLTQLREFGFMNEELNLSILVQCDGNVATAMEILIDDANQQ